MVAFAVVLALIGVMALVVAAIVASGQRKPMTTPAEPDLAAPYREGLHAAIRLQQAAQDFEHQLYVEAIRHRRPEP